MAQGIFVRATQAKYNALTPKSQTSIYFTTDTHSLYVGDTLYTEAVRFYTGAMPVSPATGVLYFNTDTGKGSAWNGTAWTTVILPAATVINDSASDDMLATAKAVKDFVEASVDDAIDEVTGGSTIVADIVSKVGSNGTLGIVKGDGTEVDVPLTGIAHDPVYDDVNLKLTLPVVGGSDVVVNIPKDNFVESGTYDAESDELVLSLKQSGEVRIPAGDLVDIYTSGSGVNDTVTINVGSDNKISAVFKVDTTGVLGIAADGKLTIDLTNYATVSSVEALGSAINVLNGSASTAGSVAKAAADSLAEAKSYADNLDSEMDSRMDAVEGNITTLKGDAQTAGSVAKAVADAVAGMTTVTNGIDGRVGAVEAALTWSTLA